MDKKIKSLLVRETNNIKDVMRVVDRGALGIAFILDEKNHLVGLVTDGDIRRAILTGINLEKPIREIMNSDPFVVYTTWSKKRLHKVLHSKDVRMEIPKRGTLKIPVLDKEKHVKNIIFVSDGEYGAELHIDYELVKGSPVKRVLVIGGAGYLGSILSKKLLEKGYRVRVLDNLMYNDSGIKPLLKKASFEFIKGDMRDISTVVDAIKGIDAVIHLAAIVGDPASSLSPQNTIEINYLATNLVAEVCKYHQVNRFIFASTCSVYGFSSDPKNRLDENAPLNPVSLYAEMKIKSEDCLLSMVDGNFSPTILRMATLYGLSPRMRFDLVVNLLTAKAVFDNKITIFGGSQWRPHLHVEDAADAFITCLECPIEKVNGEIFNVGSNEQNYQIAKIGEIIHEVIPTAKIETTEEEDERNYNISFDKIHDSLGYKVKRGTKEGIIKIKNAINEGKIKDYKCKKYSNYNFLKR